MARAADIRNIFRAVHEQKMLAIEYRNAKGEVTRYWIGIQDIDPRRRTLAVRGMHLVRHTIMDLTIKIDGIIASDIVDGTYFKTPVSLRRKLDEQSELFEPVFGTVPNLKILDYLSDCTKLEAPPEVTDYELIPRIDEEAFSMGARKLDDDQFDTMVRSFQIDVLRAATPGHSPAMRQLVMNVLSVHTGKGLYVLAYRELRLDVERRTLVLGNNTIFCREFVVSDGKARQTMSIHRFLDEDGMAMLAAFDLYEEQIKDRVSSACKPYMLVDDEPHVFQLVRRSPVDLEKEFDAICEQCADGTATYPIRAFFGNLTRRPVRRKEYPLVLVDSRANLDQLLTINQAARFPLTYVQGPPGTGKTSTIVNILVNALFNKRTVLFASYNNHPVDGVYQSLTSLTYRGKTIPLPILRLGNRDCVENALRHMHELYEQAKTIGSSARALENLREHEGDRTSRLMALLRRYEERVDLDERRECVMKLLETNHNLNFGVALEEDQLTRIDNRLGEYEPFEDMLAEARELVDDDLDALMGYLYLRSARHVRRLGEPRNADLLKIVTEAAEQERGANEHEREADGQAPERKEDYVTAFNKWCQDGDNLKRLLRIFPIIATTCISASRLGGPKATFDLCVIDEASQCDTATALIPIVRAQNLALVGDPQQLNPVVTMDHTDNRTLMRSYGVPEEYDYVENSVYKVFLACDAVSNEILLREHYRCDKNIIEYSNRKYYSSRLLIRSGRHNPDAVEFLDVEYDTSTQRNTAPGEAAAIVAYAKGHPQQSIGIITPFVNQSEFIKDELERSGVTNATCGTVHSFQGDEKDVILFSLGLTKSTRDGTYRWLCRNRELINVATSRARDRLVIVCNGGQVERLHQQVEGTDDLYELVEYVRSKGRTTVTPRSVASRALGVKPYSTRTEAAFLETLSHALDNIFLSGTRHVVQREVAIAHVFGEDFSHERLFYSGRFDFVVYEARRGQANLPVLAIELDGKEHLSDEAVRKRDRTKEQICQEHGFQLIRVENSYARRYYYIKEILIEYFSKL